MTSVERPETVAVLGAGHGGQALSAYLAMKGMKVNLYELPDFSETLEPIRKLGGINVEGVVSGFAKLNKVTTDIEEAITNVPLIFIVVPALGHRKFFEKCVPILSEGQIVVIVPGNYGALELGSMLKASGKAGLVTLAETESFIGASRRISPAHVHLFAVKDVLRVSSFPAMRIEFVLGILKSLFDQVIPAANVLETSMNNINPIGHPIPMILNAGRIEDTNGDFAFFEQGVTVSVARVMEAVDAERLAVANAIGVRAMSCKDLLTSYYGVKGETLYEVIQNHEKMKKEKEGRPYSANRAPDSLKARYISEDVPFGLVPIASLGLLFDIPTPATNANIQIASLLNGVDYWKEGRTAERLGLAGLTVAEILKYLEEGPKP